MTLDPGYATTLPVDVLHTATAWLGWHPEYGSFSLNVSTHSRQPELTLYIHVHTIAELHQAVAVVPWEKPSTENRSQIAGVRAITDQPGKYESYSGEAFGGRCVVISRELGDLADIEKMLHLTADNARHSVCAVCNWKHSHWMSCDAAQQLSS